MLSPSVSPNAKVTLGLEHCTPQSEMFFHPWLLLLLLVLELQLKFSYSGPACLTPPLHPRYVSIPYCTQFLRFLFLLVIYSGLPSPALLFSNAIITIIHSHTCILIVSTPFPSPPVPYVFMIMGILPS